MEDRLHESVTEWIARLKVGDPLAAQRIWECYVERLVRLARKRLTHLPARMVDEQDAIQSVFRSFFRRAKDGGFPKLFDRNDLWQLLVTISVRKSQNLLRNEWRKKRGGGRVHGYLAPRLADTDTATLGMEQFPAVEPTPEFAAIFAEEFERFFEKLEDPALRELALLKFEGYTNPEIAERLDCSERTVERRLNRIRKIIEPDEVGESPEGTVKNIP